jgi:Electron transfer DM13
MSRRWLFVGLAALIVAVPIAYYLISPLFITRAVNEALPGPAVDFDPAQATAAMEEAMAAPATAMAEAMPPGDMADMTLRAQGDFYDVIHSGTGRALVYQLPDGSVILRFEDFEVLNGPDLHVYLVPIDPVPSSVGTDIPGYRDLGPLKGNVGSQNYDLPADVDLADFRSVVIWCQPFRVPFAAAPLNSPQ